MLRLKPHYISIISTKEVQILIRTRSCKYAKCTFCSLKNVDRKWRTPLSEQELIAQLGHLKELPESKFGIGLKPEIVSILINSHSLLDPDVVNKENLLSGLLFLKNTINSIDEIKIESRVDYALTNISSLELVSEQLVKRGVKLSLNIGVESPNSRIREMIKKPVSEKDIVRLGKILKNLGGVLRLYMIVGLENELLGTQLEKEVSKIVEWTSSFSSLFDVELYLNKLYPSGGFKGIGSVEFINSILRNGYAIRGIIEDGVPVYLDLLSDDQGLFSGFKQNAYLERLVFLFNSTQDLSYLSK